MRAQLPLVFCRLRPMMSEMHVTMLRPAVPARFKRARHESVETLLERISELTVERQRLRERDASGTSLERNRLKLARAQWQLSHALIERHLAHDERKTPAAA